MNNINGELTKIKYKHTIVKKIITGGQTGVDRAGLDIAIKNSINHGGSCPKGRIAEDGTISKKYLLVETESSDYSQRTIKNILDSDGTLIIVPSEFFNLVDGTKLTINECMKNNKPYLIISLTSSKKVQETLKWIEQHHIQILNIAGPRESNSIGIYNESKVFLEQLFNKNLSHL